MLRIVTFGEATISVGGEQVAPSAHRTFALALCLAAERGRAIPRSVLQAQLFAESNERAGSHNLRQLVYRLRLLGAPIVTTASTLSLAAEHATLDYVELLDAPALGADQLDLVAKGFLPGYAPIVSDAYLEWVDGFRGRVTLALRRKALESMAAARDRCDWNSVARAADACLALDPLNEDAILGQAEALAMSGSKVEALARIDRYLSDLPSAADDCRDAARRLRQRILRRVSEPAPLGPREMPLVGREDEMRRLTAALARTKSDGGGVVLISGEPGIGKTRLLTEFERLAALSGAQTARVVCRASTSHQPLSPFIELTRMLLQMPGALGCSPEALERLRDLLRHNQTANALPDMSQFDATARFTSLAASVVDLIDAIAAESLLVIALDDVQWIDETSLDVVRVIFRSLAGRPNLLLLSGRSGWPTEPRWNFLSQSPTLHLPALNQQHSRELLGAYAKAARRALVEGHIEWVLRFGQGNPLYLQLLCVSSDDEPKPDSGPLALRDLLQQRIDWLDPDARTVLEAVCLLGRHAAASTLERVLELTPLTLVAQLRQLETAGLIEQDGFAIASAHPLVADIAGSTTPASVRLLLNGRIAQILSMASPKSQDVALLWDCADHWAAAGQAEEAAVVLRRCAAHCVGFGRPTLAIQSLERALATPGLTDGMRRVVLSDASICAGLTGDWNRVLRILSELEQPRQAHAPRTRLDPESKVLRLDAQRVIGDVPRTLAEPWDILVDQQADRDTRMRAAAFLVAHAEDFFDAALAKRTRDEVAKFSEDEDTSSLVGVRFWFNYHACFGSMERTRELCLGMAARFRPDLLALDEVNLHYNTAYALVRCGLRQEATNLLEGLLLMLREWDLASQEAWCLTWMAWVAAESGEWQRVTELLEAGRDGAERGGIELPLPFHFVATSRALHFGDGRAARAHLMCLEPALSDEKSPRQLLHIAQLRARTSHELGESVSEEDLATLIKGHNAARSFGMHDEIVGALCIALCDHGTPEDARQYLTSYLSEFRRDPFEVPRELLSIANALDAKPGISHDALIHPQPPN